VTPLIAIPGRLGPTADNVRGDAFAVGQRYLRAVQRAGGQAVMLPPVLDGEIDPDRMLEVMSRFDGLILHGGGDIKPERYGEVQTTESLYGLIEEHDALEFAAIAAAIELDLPVLAICRGHQVLNVHLGGTLVQDTGESDDSLVKHSSAHHPVTVDADSRLAAALGTVRPQRCHSVHHQVIKDLGAGLVVTARSDDGQIEATELVTARWIVSTQWHPEDDAELDPVQQNIFDALIAECRHRQHT
jgi:putative glutamine amidotransferase